LVSTKASYINNLETQINELGNAYASLVSRRQEMSEIHKTIGMASRAISIGEKGSDRDLSDAFEGLSSLHFQLQSLNHEIAVESKVNFEDVLRDYSRMISTSKEMLDNRTEKMGLYQESVAVTKVNSSSETQRVGKPQSEKESFEKFSNNCKSDLERFELAKTSELYDSLSMLVQVNVNYEVRVANLWKTFFSQVSSSN